MTSEGFTSSMCSRITPRLVSVTSNSPPGISPCSSLSRRMARILICRSDSSPETYSTKPVRAISSATCNKSVLLPMPGSPPTRTIEPGTIPPPNTRANSPMESGQRSSTSPSISVSRRGVEAPVSPRPAVCTGLAGAATISSTMLFQAPHCGQRPMGRAAVRPHCWQTY